MKATIQAGELATWIIPPIIQARMTGVVSVAIASGNRCCACYEDGTREFAIVEEPNRDNFFTLVRQIQTAARATGKGL